jgi:phosphotransferase system HPr-like phosphotransfer protein
MSNCLPTSEFLEKASFFSEDLIKCCRYILAFSDDGTIFTKRFYSKLISTTKLLEDLLDFHGAKNNKKWYFYRELTATVVHLSRSAYSQKHINNRLRFYSLPNALEFENEGKNTLNFLNEALGRLAPVILEETALLDLRSPSSDFARTDFPTLTTSEMLNYDIDDEDRVQQNENLVKIASDFLRIAGEFEQFGFFRTYEFEQMLTIIPLKINEVEVRRYEMLVHNLQSAFDTYVIHGGYQFGNRKLKELRGYFSVCLHLLEMAGSLLHLYERHLHDAGYKNTYKRSQERLSELVDPKLILNRIVNYGLYYSGHFLNIGKTLAQAILNEHIERSSIRVGIPVTLGFHTRPSLLVAKIVQHYGGEVTLCVGQDRFDASSVLDIQWAGGKIHKENIQTVVFEGDTRALKDIEILAGVNYGEDSMGKGIPLPAELTYLK